MCFEEHTCELSNTVFHDISLLLRVFWLTVTGRWPFKENYFRESIHSVNYFSVLGADFNFSWWCRFRGDVSQWFLLLPFFFLHAELSFSKFAIGQIWLNMKDFIALLFECGVHDIICFPSKGLIEIPCIVFTQSSTKHLQVCHEA